uniref:Uncharacterized protein n=1 Tax=Chenopodium quinoa TaxID=63459 RepID=A0A803MT85_CHEQI
MLQLEVELSRQRHDGDLQEKNRLARVMENKKIFQERVVGRRQSEFERLRQEREEHFRQIREARKQERVAQRKMLFYLRSEEERLNRLREEEEARKREEAERRRKEDAERQAKLDEIAEKQRQRERELEEKERLRRQQILAGEAARSSEASPLARPQAEAPQLQLLTGGEVLIAVVQVGAAQGPLGDDPCGLEPDSAWFCSFETSLWQMAILRVYSFNFVFNVRIYAALYCINEQQSIKRDVASVKTMKWEGGGGWVTGGGGGGWVTGAGGGGGWVTGAGGGGGGDMVTGEDGGGDWDTGAGGGGDWATGAGGGGDWVTGADGGGDCDTGAGGGLTGGDLGGGGEVGFDTGGVDKGIGAVVVVGFDGGMGGAGDAFVGDIAGACALANATARNMPYNMQTHLLAIFILVRISKLCRWV